MSASEILDLARTMRCASVDGVVRNAMIYAQLGRPADLKHWRSRLLKEAPDFSAERLFDITGDYVVYVGRIEREKGCARLFDHFSRYVQDRSAHLNLLLVGRPVLPTGRPAPMG